MPDELTFDEAFTLVWADVEDSVYRHPTPLEALRYAVEEITPDELSNTFDADPRVHAAYQIVRDAHGICRRCHLTCNDDAPRGGHAVDCALRD